MIKESSGNRYLSKSGLVVLILLLLTAFAVDYLGTSARHELAPGTLTDIGNIETLRSQFNHDAGQIRLIILMSPT